MGMFYQAMEEVGGDFVETVVLPDNRLLLALGDVSGHGWQGALLAAGAGHILRGLAFYERDLRALCSAFYQGIHQDFLPGGFLTCWICLVDLNDDSYQSISLGHAQPFIIDPEGAAPIRRCSGRGAALGLLRQDRFESSLQVETGHWASGSTILVCSDGLEEHGPSPEDQFGDERIMSYAIQHAALGPQELADSLSSQCLAFARREYVDDVSILAVRRN